jgi:hypothetical protein
MAIPSGSGTEVLKRHFVTRNDTNEVTLLTGVANHIYTILSVIISETAGNSQTFGLYLDPSAAGTNYEIIPIGTSIGGLQTFVFSDRLVLSGTDQLHFITDMTAGQSRKMDVVISYIDQDWT